MLILNGDTHNLRDVFFSRNQHLHCNWCKKSEKKSTFEPSKKLPTFNSDQLAGGATNENVFEENQFIL